jgi:acyl carrier protein
VTTNDRTEEIATFVLSEVAAILGRRTVTIDEDFFEIGGDSLDALELVERVEGRFGPVPALNSVFSMRSLGEIAEAIGAARA